MELLKKGPGISAKSVEGLVAKIGFDMSVSLDEMHLDSCGQGLFQGTMRVLIKKVDEQLMEINK